MDLSKWMDRIVIFSLIIRISQAKDLEHSKKDKKSNSRLEKEKKDNKLNIFLFYGKIRKDLFLRLNR